MGTWHLSAFSNRYMNHSGHHSRMKFVDDAESVAVAVVVTAVGRVLVEVESVPVEATEVADSDNDVG